MDGIIIVKQGCMRAKRDMAKGVRKGLGMGYVKVRQGVKASAKSPFGPKFCRKFLQYSLPHAGMHAFQVTPSKYDLLLKPDLKRFTFDGEVKIHVDISEATKFVDLHAKEVW